MQGAPAGSAATARNAFESRLQNRKRTFFFDTFAKFHFSKWSTQPTGRC